MNDELNPVEEQALDAMLAETLAGPGPPDLSEKILQQWHANPAEIAPIVSADRPRKRETRASSSRRNVTILITAMAALAATFLIAVWLRTNPQDPAATAVAGNDPDFEVSPLPEVDSPIPQIAVRDAGTPQPDVPQKSSRGIPLVMGSDTGVDEPVEDSRRPTLDSSQDPVEPVMLVSKQIDSELRNYWEAIGIDPAEEAHRDDVAARLAAVLGIELPAEAIDDPQLLQETISGKRVSRAIARSWLQLITEGGPRRLDDDARRELVNELAACFQSKQEFDRTLAAWIGGKSSSTPAFYSAIASGPRHASDSTAMIRRLAALTMNVDLRCTRCHDSYIEGNGRHEDYVAFKAFVRRGVTRERDGSVTVDRTSRADEPVFYELADGRQRVTQAAVAAAWMKDRSDQAMTDVQQWSDRLVGSEELARGVVNSLWQLIHGEPLHGRVVDPISAPHHESLADLEGDLARDLMSSRFNLARTLALIVTSPATRRGVPPSLLPENALVADESEIEVAKNAVNAFAAAQPPRTRLPMQDRLAQAMRAAGAKLSTDDSPIVAQIGNDTNSGAAKSTAKPLAADFPATAKSLPVQWLDSIEDPKSQIEHLAYLAGMSEVPEEVFVVANESETASDRSTALHRVWWMLRP